MYTCPCCGYIVFDEFPGSYDICPVCFWEDDAYQLYFVGTDGGANAVSLIEAQVFYFQVGACDPRMVSNVRKPSDSDIKDQNWFPLFNQKVDVPDPEISSVHPGKIKKVKDICYWLQNV